MEFVVRAHRLAQIELGEAIDDYNSKRQGLGQLFYEQFNSLLERIKDNPFQFLMESKGIRKAIFSKYPFVLYFTIEGENEICILAVVHQKRAKRNLFSRLKDTF